VNPTQKRKAVEEALMPFIQGKTLINALILWDQKYAHKPNFALQHYLRELCSDLEIAHMRSRMLQALVSTFSSLQDTRQNNALSDQQTRARATHTMALVEQLIDSAKSDAATRVRLYVLENLETIPLQTQERWAFHSWLNQIAPLTGTTPNITTMQQVINLAYVALCEYLGPIKADQLLQNTVSDIQQKYPNTRVSSLL
jgi:hypothetical protein